MSEPGVYNALLTLVEEQYFEGTELSSEMLKLEGLKVLADMLKTEKGFLGRKKRPKYFTQESVAKILLDNGLVSDLETGLGFSEQLLPSNFSFTHDSITYVCEFKAYSKRGETVYKFKKRMEFDEEKFVPERDWF